MRTTLILALFCVAAACSDDSTVKPDGPPTKKEAGAEQGTREGGTHEGGGPQPCAACAADEVCVQSFDGTCNTGGPACVKVTAKCRNIPAKLGVPANPCPTPIWDGGAPDVGDGSVAEKSCSAQYCSDPYSCANAAPCGTEHASAQVYCYGP